jgi:hypothetical protein
LLKRTARIGPVCAFSSTPTFSFGRLALLVAGAPVSEGGRAGPNVIVGHVGLRGFQGPNLWSADPSFVAPPPRDPRLRLRILGYCGPVTQQHYLRLPVIALG